MKQLSKTTQRLLIKVQRYKSSFSYALSKINNNKNRFILFLICIMIYFYFLGASFGNINNQYNSSQTLIHYINIGQGDAILITNNDFNILIDGGSNKYEEQLITYLKKQDISIINFVIATHPHEDHIGSMDAIIKNFKINTFIAPAVTTDDIDFINLIKALKSKNLKINIVEDNFTINLGNEHNLTFLWAGNTTFDNINNNSLVLKYTNKDVSFLFTGDIEKEIESRLQYLTPDLMPSTVLKVAHHGSGSSSTMNFLNIVNPSISIITCGIGNDYGHPHKNTLKNLSDINSKIYRTDINGNIIIKTDGTKLWINSEYSN